MLGFLGIGAQKAGTTWLYEMLRQHPDLGFPTGKESHYWTMRTTARDTGAVQAYLAQFQDPRRREGEMTPGYAALDEAAIACLGAAAPRLRLIFMLRNPLERAWSAALMVMARLDMELDEASDAWFLDLFRSRASLNRGDYAETIRRWCRWFPREALLTPTYESLRTDPEGLVNACLRHIGVAELDSVTLRRLGSQRVIFAGQHHPLPLSLWVELRRLYEGRIAELEQLIDLDLSDWLTPPQAGEPERAARM